MYITHKKVFIELLEKWMPIVGNMGKALQMGVKEFHFPSLLSPTYLN